jgi:hypothetical protein
MLGGRLKLLEKVRIVASAWVVMLAFLQAVPPIAAAPPGNPIAILDSARTSGYFSLHYGTCVLNSADPNAMGPLEYRRYWGGWEQILLEMKQAGQIPGYDVVTDGFLTSGLTRSSYKVLILSNNVGLTQQQTDAIRQWVGGGRHLLATFGSGYEGPTTSEELALASTTRKNTLQQLWKDPLTKFVTTGIFGTVPPPEGGYPPGSVEPRLTRIEGPTANYCQFLDPVGGVCPWYFQTDRLVTGYGDLANMLIGRGENHPGAYAHFVFANNLSVFDPNNIWLDTQYNKPLPAIVGSNYKKGQAVYYAFAPEFIVGLEFDSAGHCATDPNYPGGDITPGLQTSEMSLSGNHWWGRTRELRALMKSSVHYLLTAP